METVHKPQRGDGPHSPAPPALAPANKVISNELKHGEMGAQVGPGPGRGSLGVQDA